MNLNDYIKTNKIKVSTISNITSIPYTTINDVVKGKTDIDNVSVKVFLKLSKALGLSEKELYTLAKNSSPTPELKNGYTISLKNGKYYIKKGEKTYYLCKNTPVQARFIEDIANTFINNIERNLRMDTWQTML